MGALEDRIAAIVALIVVGAFFLTIVLYGATLLCALIAVRRLCRNLLDPAAYAWLVGALVVPAATFAPLLIDDARLSARTAEIASWPRTVPDPTPRNLVIYPRNAYKASYALELAETGLFDVYLIAGRVQLKAEVSERTDCRAFRHERVRFAAMMGFLRCAKLVEVATLPREGLFLFEEHWEAPFRPRNFGDGERHGRVNWAIQLVHRHDGRDDLVAYAESVRRKTLKRVGIFFYPSLERINRDRDATGRRLSDPPDPAQFLYKSLELDPDRIQPQ